MTDQTRPSDAQLRSAADRIRRLSAGLESPGGESADLATFSEEAIRRTYRIVELGVGFWMDLLRLNPERKLSINGRVLDGSEKDPGWLFGRTLGATIRSWGDLKNAQRGLLWFDSSPLLGPKIGRAIQREDLEGHAKPGQDPMGVVRLLSESAVDAICEILKERWTDSWDDEESPEFLWLGIQAGALEREQRNPQGVSKTLLRTRSDTVLAYCIERDLPKDEPTRESPDSRLAPVRLVESPPEDLANRFEKLRMAQGGRDTDWRPLYSFLRRGDVVVITLAGDLSSPDGERWGQSWSSGRPLALAIVTSPTNWDNNGWWGRLGSVLFIDGPANDEPKSEGEGQDRERLRTAFRFPSEGKKKQLGSGDLGGGNRDDANSKNGELEPRAGIKAPDGEPQSTDEEPDPLAVSFGFAKDSKKTTDSLGLERAVLYRSWLGEAPDPGQGQESSDDSADEGRQDRIDQALIEPIPVGFPGPWRRVKNHDLRATLGEFLEPHATTVGFFEHKEAADHGVNDPWNAWYPANLNIERFALTSDNLRLGVTFDNPLIPDGRPSAQRIAPDPIPDPTLRKKLKESAEKSSTSDSEWQRVQVANAHRLTFDHYKRGMKRGVLEEPPKGTSREEQERAAAFMPAITLDPEASLESNGNLISAGRTHTLWPREARESDPHKTGGNSADSRTLLAMAISEVLGKKGKTKQVTVAGFPESERTDLYRALDSRAFAKQGLSSKTAKIPIDPAGSRIRDACLITKDESNNRLLIVLTDDSVAAVDIGAITWLLLAYGPELKSAHLLDEDAYVRLRQRDSETRAEEEGRSRRQARKRSRKAWKLVSKCKLDR